MAQEDSKRSLQGAVRRAKPAQKKRNVASKDGVKHRDEVGNEERLSGRLSKLKIFRAKQAALRKRTAKRDLKAKARQRDILAQVEDSAASKMAAIDGAKRTKSKADRVLQERRQILARVAEWAGSDQAALDWYLSTPIPSLGDQTAEGLVESGEANLVRSYLNRIASGGYA